MRIICAWCKEFLREKEPLYDKSISHGICEKCYIEVREQIKKLNGVPNLQGSKKRAKC